MGPPATVAAATRRRAMRLVIVSEYCCSLKGEEEQVEVEKESSALVAGASISGRDARRGKE